MTFRPGTWVSALMISSARPSLKYSFSGSRLMFAKGSTAIDGCWSAGLADGLFQRGSRLPPSPENARAASFARHRRTIAFERGRRLKRRRLVAQDRAQDAAWSRPPNARRPASIS